MNRDPYEAIYQINTRVWLGELSQRRGAFITLATIPDSELDLLVQQGFGWVWFLGVWTTGMAGQQVSAANPTWRREYEEALGSDLREEDICGSPFAIKEYTVHPDFGGDEALALLRTRLKERKVKLLLDFVPNHTALDHRWVRERPEFYIQGTEADLAREPFNFHLITSDTQIRIFAYGRDPHYHGWPDTLQLNYRHPGLRKAMEAELVSIAGRCDGIRCDMAMLLLPNIFVLTWGSLSVPQDGVPPTNSSFWSEAIALIRQDTPDFKFMAEVYWDLEYTLQQEGFDYTYDKRLYDRLLSRDASAVRSHLQADIGFQRKMVLFIENHDEARAASAFPPEIHRAAAVLSYLLPGSRLYHEGQLEGRKIKLPIHLGRRPTEAVDPDLSQFYENLLRCMARPEARTGQWQLLECRPAWEESRSCDQFVASSWEGEAGERLLVVVNYAPHLGTCYVRLPFAAMRGKRYLLRDLFSSDIIYERRGEELVGPGLYVQLPAWGFHVFEFAEAILPSDPTRQIERHTQTV